MCHGLSACTDTTRSFLWLQRAAKVLCFLQLACRSRGRLRPFAHSRSGKQVRRAPDRCPSGPAHHDFRAFLRAVREHSSRSGISQLAARWATNRSACLTITSLTALSCQRPSHRLLSRHLPRQPSTLRHSTLTLLQTQVQPTPSLVAILQHNLRCENHSQLVESMARRHRLGQGFQEAVVALRPGFTPFQACQASLVIAPLDQVAAAKVVQRQKMTLLL